MESRYWTRIVELTQGAFEPFHPLLLGVVGGYPKVPLDGLGQSIRCRIKTFRLRVTRWLRVGFHAEDATVRTVLIPDEFPERLSSIRFRLTETSALSDGAARRV